MITLSTRTIGRLFQKRIALTPERPAIGQVENNEVKHLTFTQYRDVIQTLAAALVKNGVQVGDRFGILAQTTKEWHLIDMGAMIARAVVIPVYHTYTGKEASYILNHSECTTLVVENDRQMEKIVSQITELTHLKNIIALNDFSEEMIKKFRNKWNYITYKDWNRRIKNKSRPD
jgi:long-chain acyl-CoA synthetase